MVARERFLRGGMLGAPLARLREILRPEIVDDLLSRTHAGTIVFAEANEDVLARLHEAVEHTRSVSCERGAPIDVGLHRAWGCDRASPRGVGRTDDREMSEAVVERRLSALEQNEVLNSGLIGV